MTRWTDERTDIRMEGRTDGRTDILYFHSGYLNPCPAAAYAAHNYGPHKWSPKKYVDDRIERRRDRHISTTGPHWGPSYPSVGINASQRCTPTLEMNTNKKTAKGPRTTRRTDRRKYYTDTQGIWYCGLRLHALHAITGSTLWSPKIGADERTDRKTDIQKYRQTYNLGWTPQGSSGPQCGDKLLLYRLYCGTRGLRPHALHTITGFADYFQNADDWTERQTYRQTYKLNWTPLGSFRPQFEDK